MGQTSVYGLPYQNLGDTPNGPTLGQELAEAVETELARIDTSLAALVALTEVVTTTSGLTPATGFSVTAFNGRKTAGITFIAVQMERTGGTITATNNNITDTPVCTLPTGWRPPTLIFPVANIQSARHGVMTIDTAGVCTLDTASTDIILADSIKFSACWVN